MKPVIKLGDDVDEEIGDEIFIPDNLEQNVVQPKDKPQPSTSSASPPPAASKGKKRARQSDCDGSGDADSKAKVSYPAYLFQPPPPKLKKEDLNKLTLISEIRKNYAHVMLCEHAVKLFFAIKQFLKDSNPKVKEASPMNDHGYACEDID